MLDLEIVYGWINWHMQYESFLSVPVRRLIEIMKTALKKGDYQQTEHYIDLSVEVCQSLGNSLEIGETKLECAYAFIQMDKLPESIPFLRHAINLYNAQNIHNQAVALWMLGYTFWETGKQSDAIVVWERSCRIFRELKSIHVDTDWYARASEKMCSALEATIDQKTGF
jgi:tetratricopeptide (TPR) repeat protein